MVVVVVSGWVGRDGWVRWIIPMIKMKQGLREIYILV